MMRKPHQNKQNDVVTQKIFFITYVTTNSKRGSKLKEIYSHVTFNKTLKAKSSFYDTHILFSLISVAFMVDDCCKYID